MKFLRIKLLFFLCFLSATSFAGTKWEVATIFLGATEDSSFQADVEQNLAELAKIAVGPELKISLYREAPGKTVAGVLRAGETFKLTASSRAKLQAHLKASFKDDTSKKALFLYGHGKGPEGLRDLRVGELKKLLAELKLKLDVFWLDSCFLGNIEFLYELRRASRYVVASQEAEFSAGLPFDSLDLLPTFANGKDAAVFLARGFIESYSYLKRGRQRGSVAASSATIAVVDNTKLASVVKDLQVLRKLEKRTESEREALAKRLAKNFAMDDANLVDLGSLLVEFRKLNDDKETDAELTKLIRALNISSVRALKTNPRIHIAWPKPDALIVYGFNGWTVGADAEYAENSVISGILKADEFVEGPEGKRWPARKNRGAKTLVVTPFAPNLNTFDYYFVDAVTKKRIGEIQSVYRGQDLVESTGEFLIYQAYTQRVGKKAEKYTGLSITNIGTVPSLDYFELEFNRLLEWLKL